MTDPSDLPYRPCAGVMLLNRDGKAFVGQRLDNVLEAWQMPQGGIDPGEDALAAATRELWEETGITADKVTLIAEAPISFTTASLGGQISIPGIDGARIDIKIPAGIQSGEQLRQRGAGMSVLQGRGRGDLITRILVETPTKLTRETVEASVMAITLGCGEECPYVPGVKYVDWPVADPGGQDEETVRGIIADLDARVRNLLVELVPGVELAPSVLDKQ